MSELTIQAPAAWYADPEDAAQLRYWDGTRWTDHRAPVSPTASARAPEPAADSLPVATAPAATFSSPDPMTVGSSRSSKTALLVLAALALSVITGVTALTAGASLVPRGGSSTGKASSQVTRAAYDAKSAAVCAKYNVQASKVSQSLDQATNLTGGVVVDPSTARQVGHAMLELAKISGREATELRRLDRPIADSPRILEALAGEDQMVTEAKNLGDAYLRLGTDSGADADTTGINAANEQLRTVAESAAAAFQDVGASECAGH